jgi:hypothetical protein
MAPPKRVYEPRIFEGRVMLPEEQEQIYEEITQHFRAHGVREPDHARADHGRVA